MIKHDDRSLSETAVSLHALKSYIGGWIEFRFGCLAGSETVPGNEELECFHLKDFCDAVHHIDGRAVNASFQGTDVSAMDVCTVREFLLRKPPGVSQRPEIERKDLANIHDPESYARCSAFRVYSAIGIARRYVGLVFANDELVHWLSTKF